MNKKRIVKSLCLLVLTTVSGMSMFFWRGIVSLVDLLDGDDDAIDDPDDLSAGEVVHYNYRTGEIDAVKHLDGFYDKSP